jgi:NAD(P)-dependent dehydrogenase (short-subunit alcohol dehydrogenase family)
MGTNVLGHWGLISHLLPIVVATPGARVVTLSSTAQHMGRAIDPSDPHMRNGFDAWRMYGQTKLAMRHLAVGLQEQFDRAGVDAKALSAQPGMTNSELQTTSQAHGAAGPLGSFFSKWVKATGMSTERGALSQLRAAVDPKAPGGGFYGPLFVTNGPPVRKPLIRPGSARAVAALWEVAESETGLRVDVGAVARR